MLTAPTLTPEQRFRITERAEPIRLRPGAAPVCGYAWRHPAPAAAVVLIHGLQSHAGWFAEAADLLRDRGFTVYAFDRRGTGSTPGTRGDVERYAEWFADVEEGVRFAQSECAAVPVHLVGHCFGANLALGCALQGHSGVASIAMLTPGLFVLPDYPPAVKLRIALAAGLRPGTQFPVPQEDALFTLQPDVLAWIGRDTLGSKALTARCLREIRKMLTWLRANVARLEVPVLVLEAGRDRLSDNARNRDFLGRALGERCRFVSFPAEHFLLAEPCRDEVLDALARWLSGDWSGGDH